MMLLMMSLGMRKMMRKGKRVEYVNLCYQKDLASSQCDTIDHQLYPLTKGETMLDHGL